MHPDHPLRIVGGFGNARDRNRRGVGGEHPRRGQDALGLPQHLLLDADLLEDRLDRQFGAAEACVRLATGEQRDEPRVLVLGDAPAFETIIENRARGEDPLRDTGHVGVLHSDVDLGLRYRGARNARTHEARANDAQTLHALGRGGVRNPRILFQLVRGEKDLDELAGDIGHRELAKQLSLALQSLGQAVLQAVFDGLERGERSGVMSAGPLEHLLARRAKDDAPAQRIAVEQESHESAGPLAFGSPAACHAPRRGDRDFGQNRRRNQLIDHSQPERLRGALALARQNHVERRARADQPGKSLATAGCRENAELDLRETDLCLGMVRGHAVVARKRELEPTAETGSMDSDRDRLGEARDTLEHLLAIGREALRLCGRAERDEFFDVGAGDEVIRLAREECDGAHARIVGERGETGEKLVLHRAGNDVDGLAFEIERDGRDAVVHVPRHGGRGQRGSSRGRH